MKGVNDFIWNWKFIEILVICNIVYSIEIMSVMVISMIINMFC